MSGPTLYLLIQASYVTSGGTLLNFYLRQVQGLVWTVFVFTAGAWLLEGAAIRWKMPNVLGICAFCHSAIGSWWLVNLVILICGGWAYLPLAAMGQTLLTLFVPVIIWHVTGDILRAYKNRMILEITEPARQAALIGQPKEEESV